MCVFCSIVKGDIPSNKLYEDDMVIAFLTLTLQAMVIVLSFQKNIVTHS